MGGGLVVDDPEIVFAGKVGLRASVKDAVDSDGGQRVGGNILRGESQLARCAGVWGEQPEAVRVAEKVFERVAGVAGGSVQGFEV